MKHHWGKLFSASLNDFLVDILMGFKRNEWNKLLQMIRDLMNEWASEHGGAACWSQWEGSDLRGGTNTVCIISYILNPSELSLLCLTFKICLEMQMRRLSGCMPQFHITNQRVHLQGKDKWCKQQGCRNSFSSRDSITTNRVFVSRPNTWLNMNNLTWDVWERTMLHTAVCWHTTCQTVHHQR